MKLHACLGRRFVVILTLFLLSAPSALAFTQLFEQGSKKIVPGMPGSGKVTRTVAGKLMSPYLWDAALLREDSVVVMHAPSIHQSYESIMTGVSDLAVLSNWNGVRDGLVSAGSNGVKIHSYDRNLPGWVSQDIIPGFLNGATLVRAGDVNGDGLDDLVVLIGSEVRTAIRQAGGGFSLGPQRTIPADIYDFELLQYDVDTAKELAFATSIGLLYYDDANSGIQIRRFERQLSDDAHLVALNAAGLDRLAWYYEYGTDQVLHIADGNGLELGLDVSSVNPVGLAANDIDGDGFDDVALGQIDSLLCLQYLNGSSPPLSMSSSQAIDCEVSTSSLAPGDPLVRDLNHDGEVDILVSYGFSGETWVGKASAPDDEVGSIRSGLKLSNEHSLHSFFPGDPQFSLDHQLYLRLESNHALEAADKIRVTTWHASDLGAAIANAYADFREITSWSEDVISTEFSANQPNGNGVILDTYYINVQPIATDGSPGPTTVFVFAWDPSASEPVPNQPWIHRVLSAGLPGALAIHVESGDFQGFDQGGLVNGGGNPPPPSPPPMQPED